MGIFFRRFYEEEDDDDQREEEREGIGPIVAWTENVSKKNVDRGSLDWMKYFPSWTTEASYSILLLPKFSSRWTYQKLDFLCFDSLGMLQSNLMDDWPLLIFDG